MVIVFIFLTIIIIVVSLFYLDSKSQEENEYQRGYNNAWKEATKKIDNISNNYKSAIENYKEINQDLTEENEKSQNTIKTVYEHNTNLLSENEDLKQQVKHLAGEVNNLDVVLEAKESLIKELEQCKSDNESLRISLDQSIKEKNKALELYNKTMSEYKENSERINDLGEKLKEREQEICFLLDGEETLIGVLESVLNDKKKRIKEYNNGNYRTCEQG